MNRSLTLAQKAAVTVGVIFITILALGQFAPDEDAGTGGSQSETSSADPAVVANAPESRLGSPSVYARIEASTDCVTLQREFDLAMDNVDRYPGGDERRDVPFAYARAADARLREVGCYG